MLGGRVPQSDLFKVASRSRKRNVPRDCLEGCASYTRLREDPYRYLEDVEVDLSCNHLPF